MNARQLIEVVTSTTTAEASQSFDTEQFRKAIQVELQATRDLEDAKEKAWANLMADPQYYERHSQRRQSMGLPRETPVTPRTPRTVQRLRTTEAKDKCPLKPPPEGEFDDYEVAVGAEVEKEHTTDPKAAKTIAKHHIAAPGGSDYYTGDLKKIEPDEIKHAEMKVKRQPLWRGKKLMTPTMMALPPSTSSPSGMPG